MDGGTHKRQITYIVQRPQISNESHNVTQSTWTTRIFCGAIALLPNCLHSSHHINIFSTLYNDLFHSLYSSLLFSAEAAWSSPHISSVDPVLNVREGGRCIKGGAGQSVPGAAKLIEEVVSSFTCCRWEHLELGVASLLVCGCSPDKRNRCVGVLLGMYSLLTVYVTKVLDISRSSMLMICSGARGNLLAITNDIHRKTQRALHYYPALPLGCISVLLPLLVLLLLRARLNSVLQPSSVSGIFNTLQLSSFSSPLYPFKVVHTS